MLQVDSFLKIHFYFWDLLLFNYAKHSNTNLLNISICATEIAMLALETPQKPQHLHNFEEVNLWGPLYLIKPTKKVFYMEKMTLHL